MVGLNVIFWMYVILFALIGGMRGWAKELMVTFSLVLSLFVINVLETYVGFVKNSLVAEGGTQLFWMRVAILMLLVFFGYQSPNIPAIAGARFARERLQDTLLGFIIGALNGYLVVGTLWWFLDAAGYPYPEIVSSPPEAIRQIVEVLPPEWLVIPWIYFAVGVAFLFVIIVFI